MELLAPSISSEITKATTSIQPDQPGKFQRVLANLKLPLFSFLTTSASAWSRSFRRTTTPSPHHRRTSAALWSSSTIKTGNGRSFRHELRAIPFARRQYLEQEVERLISVGAISPADPNACPYASRTVVTPKKHGTTRLCVDYLDVNAQTEKDSFPLPRIDQVRPTLSRARFFASLDLLMGFHQVEVDPPDRAKTAFLTHRGLFVYNVMPFGLCNAPATFQRLMDKVLGPLIGLGILVYINGVLNYAETAEQLIDILAAVLKPLLRAGLKCKASKCSLFTQTIN